MMPHKDRFKVYNEHKYIENLKTLYELNKECVMLKRSNDGKELHFFHETGNNLNSMVAEWRDDKLQLYNPIVGTWSEEQTNQLVSFITDGPPKSKFKWKITKLFDHKPIGILWDEVTDECGVGQSKMRFESLTSDDMEREFSHG